MITVISINTATDHTLYITVCVLFEFFVFDMEEDLLAQFWDTVCRVIL